MRYLVVLLFILACCVSETHAANQLIRDPETTVMDTSIPGRAGFVTNAQIGTVTGGSSDNTNPLYLRPGETQNTKIEFTSNGGTFGWDLVTDPNYPLVGIHQLGFWAYSPDWSKIESTQFLVATDTGFANYKTAAWEINNNVGLPGPRTASSGWAFFYFHRDDFPTTVGAPNFSTQNIRRLRVRVQALNGNTATIYISPIKTNWYDRPTIVLRFDHLDNTFYAQEWQGYLQTRNLLGSYVYQYTQVSPTIMPDNEIQALQDAGWDIVNHAGSHDDLRSKTTDEIISNVSAAQRNLRNKGFHKYTQRIFVPPFDATDQHVIDALSTLGYNRVLGGGGSNGRINRQIDGTGEGWWGNMGAYSIVVGVDFLATFAAVKPYIDRAIKHGGMCQLQFHNIRIAGAATVDISQAVFRQIIDYVTLLRDSNIVSVMTESQWVETMETGLTPMRPQP